MRAHPENEGGNFFPRFARTDQHSAPLNTTFGSVQLCLDPPFTNPVSAPDRVLSLMHPSCPEEFLLVPTFQLEI